MKMIVQNYPSPKLCRWTTSVVREGERACVYLRELIEFQPATVFLKLTGYSSVREAHQAARQLRIKHRQKNAVEVLTILKSQSGSSNANSNKKSRKSR